METIYNAYGEEIVLDKEQQACVDYRGKKNIDLVIQGIAGAGKSLVLMKRALVFQKENPYDSIAFFTFNNTLAAYVKEILQKNNASGSKIQISTLDSYLFSLFQEMPDHFYGKPIYDYLRPRYMKEAIGNHSKVTGSSTRLHNVPVKYWLDEVTWMKRHDIGEGDVTKYLEIKRTGRGTDVRITRDDKLVVFQFFLEYCNLLKRNRLYEWEDISLFISHNRTKIPNNMRFDHIFIDEAQDQSRSKILCLYGLKRTGTADVTVAMDMNQRIYSGDNPFVGFSRQVKKLDKTYRCSVEIDALAESLRKYNDEFLDEEDKNPHVVPKISTGILPIIHECANSADEKQQVINIIKEWQERNKNITIGVLSTTNDQNDEYSAWLTDAGIRHEKIIKKAEFSVLTPGVKVATIYSTKGMEFTHVIIPQFVEGKLPNIHERKDKDLIDEEIVRYRSLAYVGMTRAMVGLVITYSGTPSRFIGEMDKKLCKFETTTVKRAPVMSHPETRQSTSELERILSQLAKKSTNKSTNNSSSRSSSSSSGSDLKSFFESKGLEVIDKRPNGGCLWVVGSEGEIGSIVNEAKSKFHAGGNYGAGRATGQRRGWFTRANR